MIEVLKSALLAAGIVGCFYVGYAVMTMQDTRPPRWVKVCTESRSKTKLVPKVMSMGQGVPVSGMRLVTVSECVKFEQKCIAGKDYRGPINACGKL